MAFTFGNFLFNPGDVLEARTEWVLAGDAVADLARLLIARSAVPVSPES